MSKKVEGSAQPASKPAVRVLISPPPHHRLSVTAPPNGDLLASAVDRLHYMMKVLVKDLELPVERDDLIGLPDEADVSCLTFEQHVEMYNYILFNRG